MIAATDQVPLAQCTFLIPSSLKDVSSSFHRDTTKVSPDCKTASAAHNSAH
jgi:hypothetical protein